MNEQLYDEKDKADFLQWPVEDLVKLLMDNGAAYMAASRRSYEVGQENERLRNILAFLEEEIAAITEDPAPAISVTKTVRAGMAFNRLRAWSQKQMRDKATGQS